MVETEATARGFARFLIFGEVFVSRLLLILWTGHEEMARRYGGGEKSGETGNSDRER